MDIARSLRIQSYLIDQLASRGLNSGTALGVAKMCDEAYGDGLRPSLRFRNLQWALEAYLPKGMLCVLSTAFIVIFIMEHEAQYVRSQEKS
jgi:hypothetical protein